MGDTNSKTTTSSEFPQEFRPLAEGAVKQLLALQNAVPIAALANFAPAGTAGIAPMQQFAMDAMTPATFMTTPAQQGAFNTQAPVNASTMGMADAGRESNAAQSALASLQSSGRLGTAPQGADMFAGFMPSMAQPSAQATRASAPPPTMTSRAAPSPAPATAPANLPAFLPPVQQPASVFPGLTPEALTKAWPKASSGAVPILGGPGPDRINPSKPLSTDAFPGPFDPNDPEFQKLQLTGRENIVLEALVKGGMSHEEAFALVKGKGASFDNVAGITPEQALALVSGKAPKGGGSSESKAPKKKKAEPSSAPKQDPIYDLNTGSA